MGKPKREKKGDEKMITRHCFLLIGVFFFAYSVDWPFNSNNQRSQLDRVMPTGAFATMFYFLFVCFFFCFSFSCSVISFIIDCLQVVENILYSGSADMKVLAHNLNVRD